MGKSTRPLNNWKQYNQALVNRGSTTFWMDEKAIEQWMPAEHHGGRGRSFTSGDTAIELQCSLTAWY